MKNKRNITEPTYVIGTLEFSKNAYLVHEKIYSVLTCKGHKNICNSKEKLFINMNEIMSLLNNNIGNTADVHMLRLSYTKQTTFEQIINSLEEIQINNKLSNYDSELINCINIFLNKNINIKSSLFPKVEVYMFHLEIKGFG